MRRITRFRYLRKVKLPARFPATNYTIYKSEEHAFRYITYIIDNQICKLRSPRNPFELFYDKKLSLSLDLYIVSTALLQQDIQVALTTQQSSKRTNRNTKLRPGRCFNALSGINWFKTDTNC